MSIDGSGTIIGRQTHSWVDSLRLRPGRESEFERVRVSNILVSLSPSESGIRKFYWVWVRVSPVEENTGQSESEWALSAKYICWVSLSELHRLLQTYLLSTYLQHYYQPYIGLRLYSSLFTHTSTHQRSCAISIFIDQRRELGGGVPWPPT